MVVTQMYSDFKVKSIFRTYDVFFQQYKTALPNSIREGDILIVDSNVFKLYPDIQDYISGHKYFIIEASEAAKTYDNIGKLLTSIIEHGFSKTNRLIGIGGGVIQDITAFSSSILFRGVEWVFFPTNLLTQCDSCIGSKTSVNCGEYKNQLGGFYPPSEIYIDFGFWETISVQEISSGLGEMLHYFFVDGIEDINILQKEIANAYDDKKLLLSLVERSLSIKRKMIEIDEFDKGPRNVFNYGHSFGHALESVTSYQVPHGIAVAIGMDLANIISAHKGLIDISVRNNARSVLYEVWKNTTIPEINIDEYFNALSKHKKNEGTTIKVILTRGFGEMFKCSLENNKEIRKIVNDFFLYKKYQGVL
jgi:3-dehydroquinate synthase